MGAVALVTPAAQPAAEAVDALRNRLDELRHLIATLPADVYSVRPSAVSGAIGAHVRHVVDHVRSLVEASPSRVLSYDHRTRGTAVERDPSVAVRELMRLDAALERFHTRELDELIAVEIVMSSSGLSIAGTSTLARELAFVMSHTIHHQAIIALLLELQGREVAHPRFGLAPTTPSRG
jgi:uncharacterized damage-inducible protein DinB